VSTVKSKVLWDENLKFSCFFPPLIRSLKLELYAEDTFGSRLLATEYIDIDSISDYNEENYFLPTLGPRHIDLYTEPENFRVKRIASTNYEPNKDTDEIEKKLEEHVDKETSHTQRSYLSIGGTTAGGGSYVARLFLHINTKNFSYYSSKHSQIKHNESKMSTKYNEIIKNQRKFVAFAVIHEATMIDPRFQGQLSFRMCIGTSNYYLNFSSYKY
jgi:hypothetical protein